MTTMSLGIYLMFVISLLFLTPDVLIKERKALLLEWRTSQKPILVDGFLVLITYMLILLAMQISNVSYDYLLSYT